MAISCIQLAIVFCLATTLCGDVRTPNVMVRSMNTFVPPTIPHPIFKTNFLKMSKVQPESWHVVVVKLHDLLTQPAIDRANVHYEKNKVLQLGLQLDFPIATNIYNSWYLYNLEFYQTSCSKCSGHPMSYIISYIQCNSHTTICNFFATNIHVKFLHAF